MLFSQSQVPTASEIQCLINQVISNADSSNGFFLFAYSILLIFICTLCRTETERIMRFLITVLSNQ